MIELYKNIGETPLEALHRLRKENIELKDETLSYAGRLDPMAEGIIHVLVGKEENQKRAEYLNKNKEYEVDFLFGISTDTQDTLGMIVKHSNNTINENAIKIALKNLCTIESQIYPWYSSKTVNGKALFEYARENDFSVRRPTRKVSIYSVTDIRLENVEWNLILEKILKNIALVTGDFRQKQIMDAWKRVDHTVVCTVASCTISVSSGTYIRGLAEVLSQTLNEPCVVLSLRRTNIF